MKKAANIFTAIFSFFGKIRLFWQETLTEVKDKAVWPTPRELAQSTLVVVVSIAILSAFVFLYDFSMHELIRFITRKVTH
ncbi:MAG: preprotein translocase subunit SecE [Puniceicoccales bacterium]|jgi:preprotein translocase SecE subunit|nr:preprotein translocase subunit SecE [Puniceicoccales bacterium]